MSFLARKNQRSLVRKYLAPSPATSKGRLKKQRANIRSTHATRVTVEIVTEQLEDEDPAEEYENPAEESNDDAHETVGPHIIPVEESRVCNMFCCVAIADANTGTFYHDMTGNFPVMSLEGV